MVRYSYADVKRLARPINLPERAFMSLAHPVSFVLANFTRVSPNAVTIVGGGCGILGSAFFVSEQWRLAGCAYIAFFVLDCSDGTIARLTDRVSARGARLDLLSDRGVLLIAILGRAAWHLSKQQPVEAWLCLGYLTSQYILDLNWLLRLRETPASDSVRTPDGSSRDHDSARTPDGSSRTTGGGAR